MSKLKMGVTACKLKQSLFTGFSILCSLCLAVSVGCVIASLNRNVTWNEFILDLNGVPGKTATYTSNVWSSTVPSHFNSPTSSVLSTTSGPPINPNVPAKCHVCGNSANQIPCGQSEILTNVSANMVSCGTEKFCMTDVLNDGKGNVDVFKRCVDEDICQKKWISESANQDYCTKYGTVTPANPFECHFCCHGDFCNTNVKPEQGTLTKATNLLPIPTSGMLLPITTSDMWESNKENWKQPIRFGLTKAIGLISGSLFLLLTALVIHAVTQQKLFVVIAELLSCVLGITGGYFCIQAVSDYKKGLVTMVTSIVLGPAGHYDSDKDKMKLGYFLAQYGAIVAFVTCFLVLVKCALYIPFGEGKWFWQKKVAPSEDSPSPVVKTK